MRFRFGLGLVLVLVLSAAGLVLAFDNYSDAIPGLAWNSFYQLNGYNFVKNHPNTSMLSYIDSAWNTAGNNWNASLKKLRWMFAADGPTTRGEYYDDVSGYVAGVAYRSITGTTTLTSCNAYINSYWASRWYTSQGQINAAAGHELGHCFGLGHSSADAMMQPELNWVFNHESPVTDDIDGIKAHYSFEQ